MTTRIGIDFGTANTVVPGGTPRPAAASPSPSRDWTCPGRQTGASTSGSSPP
jgi:hypothetical protein